MDSVRNDDAHAASQATRKYQFVVPVHTCSLYRRIELTKLQLRSYPCSAGRAFVPAAASFAARSAQSELSVSSSLRASVSWCDVSRSESWQAHNHQSSRFSFITWL